MSEEEWTDDEGGVIKKFMYVNRRGPYGTVYALESLEVVLIGAAFDQDVSMVFIDDGIFEIKKGQDTAEIGMKNFSPTYRALEMYDVEKLYVSQESLAERGLTEDDLLVDVEVMPDSQIADLMDEQDVIFTF